MPTIRDLLIAAFGIILPWLPLSQPVKSILSVTTSIASFNSASQAIPEGVSPEAAPQLEAIDPFDYIRSYAEITLPLNNMLREQELSLEKVSFPSKVTPHNY